MSLIFNQNQPDPQQNKQHKQCRICLQGDQPLIIPCKCDGTVKYVHEQCLKKWANQILKKKLKKQEEDGLYEEHSQIQCELCKQNIKLSIEWNNVLLKFQEAKQKAGQYFWHLFVVNLLITLVCLMGVVLMVAVIGLVLSQSDHVNYRKYKSQPLYMWGMTAMILAFAAIFLLKALKDMYQMFAKLQFEIKSVVLEEGQRKLQKTKQKSKRSREKQMVNKQSTNQFKQRHSVESRMMMIKNPVQFLQVEQNTRQARRLRNRQNSGNGKQNLFKNDGNSRQQILFSVRQTQKPCQQQFVHVTKRELS